VANLLRLSRPQLTALAVVSKNDYNKNISSLGPKTNIKIIRSLDASGKLNVFCSLIMSEHVYRRYLLTPPFGYHIDPEALVQGYLKSDQVVVKNEKKQEFKNAINIFIKRTQSKREVEQLPTDPPQEVPPMYEDILVRFRRIQEQLDNSKQR